MAWTRFYDMSGGRPRFNGSRALQRGAGGHFLPARPLPAHGTTARYQAGCRKECCRAAIRDYDRNRRNPKAKITIPKRLCPKGFAKWHCDECGQMETADRRCGAIQNWEVAEAADKRFYREIANKPPTRPR